MQRLRHPKGLYLLFLTEMWERFSYYGMRALLVLYLTLSLVEGGMGFTEEYATLLYGFFTGLVYFTPLIGGWLADHYIGQRKSIEAGSLLMIAGHLCLALSTTRLLLYTGLLLLILGNGFFKPNISVMVGRLYTDGDPRRDGAYTLFYMGINIGAFFAPLLTGYLAVKWGYRYGFLAAAAGLILGLLVYRMLARRWLGDIGRYPSAARPEQAEQPSAALSPEEKDRSWVIVILTLFAVVFFAGYEQAGSSLTLYTEKYIDRTIGAFEVPTAWYMLFNPLLIVVLAPLMSLLWTWLGGRRKDPPIPVKMGLGLVLLGVGFFIMLGAVAARGGDNPDTAVKASMGFVLGTYLLHTVGELCLSPIGLSMVSRLSPVKLASMMMGVWLASSFVANSLSGGLASYAAVHGAHDVFLWLGLASVLFGLLLIGLTKWLLKLSHGRL